MHLLTRWKYKNLNKEDNNGKTNNTVKNESVTIYFCLYSNKCTTTIINCVKRIFSCTYLKYAFSSFLFSHAEQIENIIQGDLLIVENSIHWNNMKSVIFNTHTVILNKSPFIYNIYAYTQFWECFYFTLKLSSAENSPDDIKLYSRRVLAYLTYNNILVL